MKIAVTGSNGFLGQYFKQFTTIDQKDIVFLTTSNPSEKQLLCEPLYKNIDDVLADQNIEIIIHFAAVIPISFAAADYVLCMQNIEMMNNLYNFSIKSGIKKFIYLSGFGSMLKPSILDIKDFYTLSKIMGEHFCAMMEANGVQTAAMRISAPYGEYAKARTVINIFIDKAMKNEPIEIFGTGKREQNFTYAGDVLQAIDLALNKKISGVYNIVSKKNTNMLELAHTIINITGSSSELIIGKHPDSQENYAPEYHYQRASEELTYEPKYTLSTGLKRYIKWLQL